MARSWLAIRRAMRIALIPAMGSSSAVGGVPILAESGDAIFCETGGVAQGALLTE